VFYHLVADNDLRGFRIAVGDLLLTLPQTYPAEGVMIIMKGDKRVARRIQPLPGGQVSIVTLDGALESNIVALERVTFVGRCVRMEAAL